MEPQKSFPEVVNTEKQMLALIYSNGVVHDDVLQLYRKTRTGYKQILLSSNQLAELHEAEYHLWKLHYLLIEEFRKRIRQHSLNVENSRTSSPLDNINLQSNADKGVEGFISFLSEATEFYRKLIVNLRKSCGLPADIFLNYKDHPLFPIKSEKLQACQHTCHRLLICLGDLARYTEIVKKSDAWDWSTAAKHYLESSRTWPDSGNPHNQLALLATYVADPFLALYHCVRSLSVKEPFPDAWRNVMLLFEENRSVKLLSLSSQVRLDFLNPSKRCLEQDSKLEGSENVHSGNSDLWLILVRTISFFLVGSSLEEFPSTFASALSRLEATLAADDAKLAVILECYQNMDSSRKGPYRAIQLVCIFIFIVHCMIESPGREERDDEQHSALIPLALASIFICMGRLTERCLRGNLKHSCPILPAVLVFLEWLVAELDTVKAYGADERVVNGISYFLGAVSDLLDRIEQNRSGNAVEDTALWEDHELRGFYPLTHVHDKLDFMTEPVCLDDYSAGNQCRLGRIFRAVTGIVDATTKGSHDWIPCDVMRRLFNSVKATSITDHGEGETAASASTHEVIDGSPGTKEKVSEEIDCVSSPKNQTEEEEVILFKPITRRNSAPVYTSKPDPVSPEGAQVQTADTDELLRRAMSLSTGLNAEDSESFTFCATTSDSGYIRSPKPREYLLKEFTTHPSGPPSLSAWVPGQGSPTVDREKVPHPFTKPRLSPIEEIASTSFSDLSINTIKEDPHTGLCSTIIHEPFVAPMPSAPLLPEDAAWLRGSSSAPAEYRSMALSETNGILGAAPATYAGWSAVRPATSFVPSLSGLVDGYPPLLGMSSTEWLYHYRNSQNMPAGNHLSPIHFNPPAYVNHHPTEASRFDQWGNHLVSNPMLYLGSPQPYHPSSSSSSLVYGAEEPKRERFFFGYQRPFPYVCGAGMELSSDQPSLVQYLKEKERQLQPGSHSQLRNPTYMGN